MGWIILTIGISSGNVLKNKIHKIFWDSDTQTNPTIQVRRSDIITDNYKKKEKKKHVAAVLRAKLKESGKLKKYQELIWELRNTWNMKAWFSLIIIGAIGIVPIPAKKQTKKEKNTHTVIKIESVRNQNRVQDRRSLGGFQDSE